MDIVDIDGYLFRYEYGDSTLTVQGKQYIFVQDERIVLLTMEAYGESLADLEEEFDLMAASFTFLP